MPFQRESREEQASISCAEPPADRRSVFNTRAFNTIEVNSQRGTIRKTSQRGTSLAKEIRWYLHLPDDLRRFVPEVFDYDCDPAQAFLEMEACGGLSLAELLLSDSAVKESWQIILGTLECLIQQFGAHLCPETRASVLCRAMAKMYQTKTLDRLSAVVAEPRFQRFCRPGLRVNGAPVFGLDEVIEQLPGLLERSGVLQAREFTIIHGDLCSSNILFDVSRNRLRVVDPRGDFGGFGLFGDSRYDLAKLCHSFEGGYDLLLTGRIDLSWDQRSLSVKPHWSREQKIVRQLVSAWWMERWPDQIDQVKLIESLLFLSMVPLHADRPDSQLAFLGRGLELFARAARTFGLAPRGGS